MALNFTYLLGAGASANSVPVVDKFHGGLHDFCVDMDEVKSNNSSIKIEELRELIEDIKETIKHSASFDTYAKKLYLSGENVKYLNYKRAISCYIFYNNLTQVRDNRYDLFFASLLEKSKSVGVVIPNNLNVISWNYDRLVEMSLCHLMSLDSMAIADKVNIYSNYTDIGQTYKNNRLNLIKLNGSAGNKFEYPVIEPKDKESALEKVLFYFNSLKNEPEGNWGIQFSWELDNNSIIEARAKSKAILEQTDHLIIIGYSFPTFNRKIDFELLRSLKGGAKIHLQTPKDDISSVKQRLNALLGISDDYFNLKVYTDTKEFFIPFEFNDINPIEDNYYFA